MDWTGLGLKAEVTRWLEAAADAQYARERKLDPFATSMRDFDDVSANLRDLRAGRALDVTDGRQRLVDLKAAGLVDPTGELSELGLDTLAAWEAYGVATTAKGDELARLLLMTLEAHRLNSQSFMPFFEYWADLRRHFDPLQLIQNWDALYAINYLDFEREGFIPGLVVRDEQPRVSEIEFDLLDYALNERLGEKAVQGAERLNNAIGGKIPRGRHRSTFCMALELVQSDGQSADPILRSFGLPKKPRVWTPFGDDGTEKILSILVDYSAPSASGGTVDGIAEEVVIEVSGAAAEIEEIKFPDGYDFSSALVDAPKPPPGNAGERKGGGAKKIDHLKKSKKNDMVGRYAEEFAFKYEQWRLRGHPDLLKKLYHASLADDTLGYDIASYEVDGTPRLIEVKGTLGPLETRFFLTAAELAAAEKHGANYVIMRVGDLQDAPKCCEIRYPFDEVLELNPAVYSVRFK